MAQRGSILGERGEDHPGIKSLSAISIEPHSPSNKNDVRRKTPGEGMRNHDDEEGSRVVRADSGVV